MRPEPEDNPLPEPTQSLRADTASLAVARSTHQTRTLEPHRTRETLALGADPATERSRAPAPDERFEREAIRLGHYVLLDELGRGGMGIVYEAYDRTLDRKVAIKLIHSQRHDDNARARLLREAQGLARLSHPNVVQVHEIGTHGDTIFVAMEFIRGRTLRDWIASPGADTDQARDWRTTLEMMLQAGRGLAAAHRAGMVHRDFKPDNAIVADDGRLRVLDFGLVRGLAPEPEVGSDELAATDDASLSLSDATTEPSSPTATPPHAGTPSEQPLEQQLTRAGTLLGTPAYMAPEQLQRQRAGPAADLFSYCVVVFEALYGRRPFAGRTLSELLDNILRGALVELDGRSDAPAPVHDALLRGLAPDPEDRWADMDELLALFEQACQPPRRRRAAWLAGTGFVSAGLVASAMILAPSEAPKLCEIDATAMAGTWDEAVRDELRASFADSPAPFASSASATVTEHLDGFARGWVDMRRSACEDTHVRGTASSARLDRRNACLERARHEFAALVEVFAEAKTDPAVVFEAPELLALLPDLSRCEHPGSSATLPEDPEARAQIHAAYAELTRAKATLQIGELDRAAELARAALEVGRSLDYRPLELESRAIEISPSLLRGRPDEGAEALFELTQQAMAEDLELLEAQLRGHAALYLVDHWSRHELDALLVNEFAASVARLDLPPRRLRAQVEQARGRLAYVRGDHEGALEHLEQAIELAPEQPEHVLQLVLALTRLGRLEEARARLEAGHEQAVERWGERSRLVADFEHERAILAIEAGDTTLARTSLADARSSYDALYGEGNLMSARVRFVESRLALNEGGFEAMKPELEAIREIFSRELGPTHELTGQVDNALGVAHFFRGEYQASLLAYERALATANAVHGPDHQEVAELHSNIGESQAALGDHQSALRSYAKALVVFERVLGPAHPASAYPHKGRGQSLLALGRASEAIAELELALELYGPGAPPFEHADTRLALARALMEGGDPARARALAGDAAQLFAELGLDAHAERARAIEIAD